MSYNIEKNEIELYSLGKIKDIIIKEIANDPDCADLILGENNPDINEYDAYDLLTGNSRLAIDGCIKNRLSLLTAQVTTKTYVLLDTYISEARTTQTKLINIVLNVFTHLSIIDLTNTESQKFYQKGYYGNRIDCTLDAISRLIDKKSNLGIGKTLIKPSASMKIINPLENYYGKSIIFEVYDF